MSIVKALGLSVCGVAIFIAVYTIQTRGRSEEMTKLISVDFEVYGVVQGVFFRKYTQKRGVELGLTGWCMNTNKGTVVGHIEGDKGKVNEMKYWLQHTGSPQSSIDKAEFCNEKEIAESTCKDFKIKH